MQPIMLYQNRQVVLIKFCHFRASILSNATVRLRALRALPKIAPPVFALPKPIDEIDLHERCDDRLQLRFPDQRSRFSDLPTEPMRWPLRTRLAFGEIS